MLRRQQQPVRQQVRPVLQRALGRHPRQFRKIIAFRQMRQNHVSRLPVVLVFKRRDYGDI